MATVLLRTLAARLAVAGWNEVAPWSSEPNIGFASIEQAEELARLADRLAASAAEYGAAADNDDLLRYRAGAHATRGQALFRLTDGAAAAEQFGLAAELVSGSALQQYRLERANALLAACRDGLVSADPSSIERAEAARDEAADLLAEVQDYDAVFDDDVISDLLPLLAGQSCP